jgi:hypothetical protein
MFQKTHENYREARKLQAGQGQALGTHLYLHFLSGLSSLGQQESFSAHGRPMLTSFAQELRAKSAEGADADRVEGSIYYGTYSDRDYYLAGRFTLVRSTDTQDNANAA